MKRILLFSLVFFSSLFLIPALYAVDQAPAKSVVAATTVATPNAVFSKVNGIDLKLDTDYSWKTLIEDSGVKAGSPEWNAARLICVASDQAWADYRVAKKVGDNAKAELLAPYSLMRGWAAWHVGMDRFASMQEVEGRGKIYVADDNAPSDELYKAVEDFQRATAYLDEAKKYPDLPGSSYSNKANGVVALGNRLKYSLDTAKTMFDKASGKKTVLLSGPAKMAKPTPAAK
jgi:hypothetical protein